MSQGDASDVFRHEAQDLLERMEHALLDLEQAPGTRALVDDVFRALHTLKGSGAMFGYDRLAAFAHEFETAFDRVRKGEAQAGHDLIALSLGAMDHLRALVDHPEDADEAGARAILSSLSRVVAPPAPVKPPASARPAGGPTTWRIRFRLPRNAMALGTNPLLLLDELRSLGDCSVTPLDGDVPPLEDLAADACLIAWDVTLTTTRPRDAIDEVFLFVLDDMELQVDEISLDADPKRLGEILVERGDARQEAVDEALAQQVRLGTLLLESGDVTGDRLKAALAEQRHTRTEADIARAAGTIRVQAERLDELMDRVGELVIAQARLRQIADADGDPTLKSVTEEIERLAAELRDTAIGMRMVPIGSLFGRFRRLVHDLSRDLGKAIDLSTSGEETELDKTMIERLNDPLVHLIRNAADHGLEDPAARTALGKPPQGRLHLAARHVGAEVLITISDDGRGLDRERIRARALEQGLLPSATPVPDAELFQLLFHPGFSTAHKVTALSGRGVGMDVVKRTIDALRGTIDITTTPGHGTEVTLRLPLTLAIIEGLLVRVGGGHYAIPLSAVEECVELSPADDRRSHGRSFLNIRGDLVPFLRLRDLFATTDPPASYPKVVIVGAGDLRVGLVVDQIIGNHQTVIKSLSKLHADVKAFSGATILGDGSVALILDVPHLVDFGQEWEQQRQAS